MRFSLTIESLLCIVLLTMSSDVLAGDWGAARLLEFANATCRDWKATTEPAPGFATGAVVRSEIRMRETTIGIRHRVEVDNGAFVELDIIERVGQAPRFVSSLFGEFGNPLLLISLSADCSLQVARRISYTERGQAIKIDTLDAELDPKGKPEWLNPPLELLERTPGEPLKHPGDATPLRVGIVDSGVNYRLPEINQRLALDTDNHLIGYDFWDMDDLPYDANPVKSGFFLQRHGTRTASILLREAPGVELVPYRYPRSDMSRMQALVEHAAENQVSILGMPLGSNRLEDWGSFERTARAHPQMLFIASAGNDGRDIDEHPVYPAALDLDNLIVVTSSNDFVKPAERLNWGRISVDYLVPAERLAALDYNGAETRVSGSSYAVSRVTALVARLKIAHRQWSAADIVRELRNRYRNSSPGARDWVSTGYVADPLGGAPVIKQALPELNLGPAQAHTGFQLPLDILVLDSRWSHQHVEQAVRQAYEILAQCSITAGEVSIHAVDADEYLRDLSTGTAHTLFEAVGTKLVTVVFARDTRMQAAFDGEAFGRGNTSTRPWLAPSVWLMLGVDDAGVALAHELYHVIANIGDHVEGVANLMQGRTRPESVELTPGQCRLAQVNGLEDRLLQN